MSFWRPPLSYTVKAVEAVGEAQEGREKDGVEAQGGVPGVIFRERPPVVALAILLLQTLLHLMRLFPFSFSFLSPSLSFLLPSPLFSIALAVLCAFVRPGGGDIVEWV